MNGAKNTPNTKRDCLSTLEVN